LLLQRDERYVFEQIAVGMCDGSQPEFASEYKDKSRSKTVESGLV
jgi:hypothetical protein